MLPQTCCMLPTTLLGLIFKFTSTASLTAKLWLKRPSFWFLRFWLSFSGLSTLSCAGRIRSFTVLIERISSAMDKCANELNICGGSVIVSFPLLNTPRDFNFFHHSAVEEMAPSWVTSSFRNSRSCRCISQLTPVLQSSNRSGIVSAGLRTELRSSGYRKCLDLQSRFPYSLPLVEMRFDTKTSVSEDISYYSNIVDHMSINPTQSLYM